jgi:hypothetical protein
MPGTWKVTSILKHSRKLNTKNRNNLALRFATFCTLLQHFFGVSPGGEERSYLTPQAANRFVEHQIDGL